MYVFLGLVILVISFLIALLTLIREQRKQEKEQEKFEESEVLEEPTLMQQPIALNQSIAGGLGTETEEMTAPVQQTQVLTSDPGTNAAVEPFPWEKKPADSLSIPSELAQNAPVSGGSDIARGGEFIIPRSVDDKK